MVAGQLTPDRAAVLISEESLVPHNYPPLQSQNPCGEQLIDANRLEALRERNRELWAYIGAVETKLGGALREVGLQPGLNELRKGHPIDLPDRATALGRAYGHLALGTNVPIDVAVESLVQRLKSCQEQKDRASVFEEIAGLLGAAPHVRPEDFPGLMKAWKSATRSRMECAEKKWSGVQDAWGRIIIALETNESEPDAVAKLIEEKTLRGQL